MYQRSALSLDVAIKALKAMIVAATKEYPYSRGAYAIADERGELICSAKQDGAPAFRTEMAIKKAYTSAQWRCLTYDMRMKAFKREDVDLTMFGLGTAYTSIAGGVPILKPGEENKDVLEYRECIGAIGSSVGPELGDEKISLVGAKVIQDILWPQK